MAVCLVPGEHEALLVKIFYLNNCTICLFSEHTVGTSL